MPGRWMRSMNQNRASISATSGTRTDDLSKANFLGEVILIVHASNGSTSNTCGTTAANLETVKKNVTKIRILGNGADIKNMTGDETVKVATFNRATMPQFDETQQPYAAGPPVTGRQVQEFPLLFTRWQGDETCLLPSKVFRTLQLKWDYSFTTSATVGYATNPLTFDLIELEYISADDPLSKLMLKETEIDAYTSTASQKRITPQGGLPLGNTHRRLFIGAYLTAKDSKDCIQSLRLGVNNFSEVIFDDRWENIQRQNARDLGMEDELKSIHGFFADSYVHETRLEEIQEVSLLHGAAQSSTMHYYGATKSGDQVTFSNFSYGTGSTTAGAANTTAGARFYTIHAKRAVSYYALLDLDPRQDLSGGIRTENVNDVKLEIGADATASSAVTLVLQEVVALK